MILDIDRLLGKAETDQEALELLESKILDIRLEIDSEITDLQDKVYYTRNAKSHNVISAYRVLDELDNVLRMVKQIRYDDSEEV